MSKKLNPWQEHTIIPWSVTGNKIWSQSNVLLATMHDHLPINGIDQEANAQFIINAVNQHAKLKEENEVLRKALKGMMNVWYQACEEYNDLELQDSGFDGSTDYVGRARQALSLAENGGE